MISPGLKTRLHKYARARKYLGGVRLCGVLEPTVENVPQAITANGVGAPFAAETISRRYVF
jgi:hypothetical protein